MGFWLFAATTLAICVFSGIVLDTMENGSDALAGMLIVPVVYMFSFLLTSIVLAVFFGIHV